MSKNLEIVSDGCGVNVDSCYLWWSRPQSFVSKFERGERRLDVVEFLDIAEALRIDPYKFLAKLAQQPQRSRKTMTSRTSACKGPFAITLFPHTRCSSIVTHRCQDRVRITC